MTTATSKQWGITPPISTALPEPVDNEKTADLIEELKRENNYEAADETKKRMSTLSLLQRVTQEFVREVSRRQRLPQSQIEQFGGKIYPYGSYRLGVYGPGSDIDTLAVAPRHVKREDFFDLFPSILRKLAGPDAISSLTAVPDSFVPIIKLVLNNIEIDLIFVSIGSLQTIPKDLSLNDNKLLDGLDPAGIRAITGPRVTDEILSLVPEPKTFRTALRAVKLWAQRRAIYANIVGYPGGVAWAMLVARVCQLYPHAVGGTIVDKFFFVIRDWNWPTPVMLKPIEQGKERVWNPAINSSDKRNIMPIITPAYPSMCATYNISKSGKTIILRELTRASQITHSIFYGDGKWSDLFKKHSFFTADHKYYLSVIASSPNPDAAKAWSGLVESKVRMLVMQLELQSNMIELARPYTKGYKRVHKCEDDAQIAEVKKGSMKYQIEETKTVESTDPQLVAGSDAPASNGVSDVTSSDKPGEGHRIYTYTFYLGIDLTAQATKNLNIVAPISYFKDLCKQWPNFSPDMHELNVVPHKSYELPDDLFDKKTGEAKPVKPAKKPKQAVKPTIQQPAQSTTRTYAEVADENTVDGPAAKKMRLMTPTPTPAPA